MSAAQFGVYELQRSLWPQKAIYNQLYAGSPIIGMCRKDTQFGEEYRYINVGYGGPQGVGTSYTGAKSRKTASLAKEFAVETFEFHGVFSIEAKLYRRYKKTGNKGLIVSPMARESKNMMQELTNSLSSYIHGNGGGAIGQITSGSDVTTQTITLNAGADRRRIEPGMKLVLSADDGTSGTLLTGEVTVASLGGTTTAPTVTVSEASWDTGIPSAAASYYVFRSDTWGNVIKGFDAWCPNHNGSPSAFLGVTRTAHPEKLAGHDIAGEGLLAQDRILLGAKAVADAGFKPDVYLMSTTNWMGLHNELKSTGALSMTKAPSQPVGGYKLGVEYDAIQVMGPRGMLKVVADPWMADNVERCLTMETWVLASCGDLLYWDDGSSPDSPHREDSTGGRECWAVGDIAFYCEAPFANARISVST